MLVPAKFTGWLVGDTASTDVLLDSSGLTLLREDSAKKTAHLTVPAGSLADHPAVRELVTGGRAHVRLLLRNEQVLIKRLTLPAAVEENLREVMGFELDRHTPFTAAQALFDACVVRRDAVRESIEILLAVAPRNSVDSLLSQLRAAGLAVDAVSVESQDAAVRAIDLLPAADKPARKWGNLLRLNLGLLVAALLLLLVAVLLPIWQKREAVIALNPVADKASADFQLSQRLFDEYTQLAGEFNYIAGKKHANHPPLVVLEELAKISPDTTSLQNFDLKVNGKIREVTLIGEAQAASKVIEVLEQSPLFQNATQRSQTRRGSQGTNEWFHVATEIKAKSLPPSSIPEAAALIVPAASSTTSASGVAPPPPAIEAAPKGAAPVAAVVAPSGGMPKVEPGPTSGAAPQMPAPVATQATIPTGTAPKPAPPTTVGKSSEPPRKQP